MRVHIFSTKRLYPEQQCVIIITRINILTHLNVYALFLPTFLFLLIISGLVHVIYYEMYHETIVYTYAYKSLT